MQQNNKVRDIVPPRKFEDDFGAQMTKEQEELHKAKQKKKIPWKALILSAGVVGVVVFGALHIVFAKASVVVEPALRQVEVHKRITAGMQGDIVSSVFEKSVQATKLFSATGTQLKDIRSSGAVSIHNTSNRSITLIPETRLMSEGGKVFRTADRAVVPAGGVVLVNVQAAEPGQEYNIPASTFSVPGLAGTALYTQMYGKSSEAMQGGATQEITVVTASDIAAAERSLVQELTQKAKDALHTQVPSSLVLLEDALIIGVEDAGTLVKEGAALEDFSFSAKVNVQGYALPKEDLLFLQKGFLAQEMKKGERLHEESVHAVFGQVRVEQEAVSFDMQVQGLVYQELNPTELLIKVRGKSKAQATQELFSYGALASSEISLWPFWINSVPADIEKIDIQVHIDAP